MGMLTHYRRALGGEHQWKIGGQFERGEHHAVNMIPTGVRFEDRGGQPLQRVSSLPAHVGGVLLTYSVFATDTMTVRDRLTITGGMRFDHSRALVGRARSSDGPNLMGPSWSERCTREVCRHMGITQAEPDAARCSVRVYGRFFQAFAGVLNRFTRGRLRQSVGSIPLPRLLGLVQHGRVEGNLQFVPDTRTAFREYPSAATAPSRVGGPVDRLCQQGWPRLHRLRCVGVWSRGHSCSGDAAACIVRVNRRQPLAHALSFD